MIDLGQKFLLMSAIHEQTFHLRQGLKLIAFKGKSVRGSPILYEQGHRLPENLDLFTQSEKNDLLVSITFWAME